MSFSYTESSLVKLSILGAAAMAIAATSNNLSPKPQSTEFETSQSAIFQDLEKIDASTTLSYRASGRLGLHALEHRGTGRLGLHALEHRGTGRSGIATADSSVSATATSVAYRASGRWNQVSTMPSLAYRGSERGIEQPVTV